jgi:hypothetical protein
MCPVIPEMLPVLIYCTFSLGTLVQETSKPGTRVAATHELKKHAAPDSKDALPRFSVLPVSFVRAGPDLPMFFAVAAFIFPPTCGDLLFQNSLPQSTEKTPQRHIERRAAQKAECLLAISVSFDPQCLLYLFSFFSDPQSTADFAVLRGADGTATVKSSGKATSRPLRLVL